MEAKERKKEKYFLQNVKFKIEYAQRIPWMDIVGKSLNWHQIWDLKSTTFDAEYYQDYLNAIQHFSSEHEQYR